MSEHPIQLIHAHPYKEQGHLGGCLCSYVIILDLGQQFVASLCTYSHQSSF